LNAKVQKDGTNVISKFARVNGLDAGEKRRLLCAPFVYSTIIAVFAVTAGLIVPASAGFDDVVTDGATTGRTNAEWHLPTAGGQRLGGKSVSDREIPPGCDHAIPPVLARL